MTIYFQGDHQLHENCVQEEQSSGYLHEGRLGLLAELGALSFSCPPEGWG